MDCDMTDCKQDMEPEFVWVTWYDGWQVGIVCKTCAVALDEKHGVMPLKKIAERESDLG